MTKIIIAAIHSWNINLAKSCISGLKDCDTHIITDRQDLTLDLLERLRPDYVFFPHWSWSIPKEIYSRFTCIVFHMTDVPFGRGGSPMQNLIARGITETKISAIEVSEEMDAGHVYLKEPLSLYGGAEEIYMRAAEIIFTKMIPRILMERIIPEPQSGEITKFTRRTPEMSELTPDMTLGQIFDYIRMLDAEGYPAAFIRFGAYTLEFSRPQKTYTGILADVRIRES